MMKLFCYLGIHLYKTVFIPYLDQPFLTKRVEDELCGEEGRYAIRCRCCNKEKQWTFQ